MTYTYIDKLSHVHDGEFIKLVKVYRASVWKICRNEVKIFIILFLILTIIFNVFSFFNLTENIRHFSNIFQDYQNTLTPSITFVLGFYVSIVVQRWWEQWQKITYNDRIAHNILTTIKKNDEYSRKVRRSLMRYIHLGQILIYRIISSTVADRYPTYDSMIDDGVMTLDEKRILLKIKTVHEKFWLPFAWFSNLSAQAYDMGYVRSAVGFKEMIHEMSDVFTNLEKLVGYDWVNIPLVYTQTVILAVWTYLIFTLFGSRYLDLVGIWRVIFDDGGDGSSALSLETTANVTDFSRSVRNPLTMNLDTIQSSSPIVANPVSDANTNTNTDPITNTDWLSHSQTLGGPKVIFLHLLEITFDLTKFLIKFVFFMGWLKVAEQLINPFGFDDDDFELNQVIDRNFEVGMRIVDDCLEIFPKLEKDKFFNRDNYHHMHGVETSTRELYHGSQKYRIYNVDHLENVKNDNEKKKRYKIDLAKEENNHIKRRCSLKQISFTAIENMKYMQKIEFGSGIPVNVVANESRQENENDSEPKSLPIIRNPAHENDRSRIKSDPEKSLTPINELGTNFETKLENNFAASVNDLESYHR